MNPGTLTSPVKGDVLEQAVALRAMGWQWDQIAAELRKRTGIERITGPMVGAVVRRAGKVGFADPKPKVEHEPLPGLSVSKGQSRNADTSSYTDAVQAVKDAHPAVANYTPVVHTTKSRRECDIEAPALRTDSKTHRANDLWISDLQLPFAHPKALEFVQLVRRDYNVPLSNMGCVGDEVDLYWASRYPKSPDARYTPNQETDAAKLELERWWHAFPQMMICDSNHRNRAAKALARGGIPERFLADLRLVLGTPEGWRWQQFWIIDGGRHRYRAEHGHKKPLGVNALRLKPLWRQMSVLWGHEHKEPGTLHLNLDSGAHVWGMRVGSLMDRDTNEANEYASEDAGMPALSVGVVTDGGKTPHVVHM